jgi:hypothetical protein
MEETARWDLTVRETGHLINKIAFAFRSTHSLFYGFKSWVAFRVPLQIIANGRAFHFRSIFSGGIRARICKRLRSPGIDSIEIDSASLCSLAGRNVK